MTASGSSHRVVVFSTPTCPWCTQAKSHLRSRGVPFRDVDVSRVLDIVRESPAAVAAA